MDGPFNDLMQQLGISDPASFFTMIGYLFVMIYVVLFLSFIVTVVAALIYLGKAIQKWWNKWHLRGTDK